MNRSILFLGYLWLLAVLYNSSLVHSADDYVDIDKDLINDIVLDFGLNREKFPLVGCCVDIELISKDASAADRKPATLVYELLLHEDVRKKLRRTDLQFTQHTSTTSVSIPWTTILEVKGVSKWRTKNGFEDVPQEVKRRGLRFHGLDPWMIGLIDISMLQAGVGGESLFWQRVMIEEGLLWAQENSVYYRGEWDIGRDGAGQSRVQVYFDKRMNCLPVRVRFMDPPNDDVKFGERGKYFVSENAIRWEKIDNGYLPLKVEMFRENFGPDKKVTLTRNTTVEYSWDRSMFVKESSFEDSVFDPDSENGDANVLLEKFRN